MEHIINAFPILNPPFLLPFPSFFPLLLPSRSFPSLPPFFPLLSSLPSSDNRDRVRLKATGVGAQGGEYINASFIDVSLLDFCVSMVTVTLVPSSPQGYKLRNAYIAAQAPLVNTMNDFWRMVWEFKSMTIVVLCRLDEVTRLLFNEHRVTTSPPPLSIPSKGSI